MQEIVGPEAAAISEQHGALEHVRGAKRRPGVAHAIRSGEHRHTGRAEVAKRRHRPVPRRIGHDGDAVVHEQVDEVAQLGLVHHAEAKRVADRDLARESQRPRALGDHANLERAELARVVQMDVHARAMAPGDAEDDVELPLRIPIDAGGIDAADQLGASLHRAIEELRGARTGDDPALGEGDDLDRDDVFQPASRRHDPFEIPQADLGVDVHVAADVQGPAAHRLAGQAFGLDVGRQPQLPAQAPLIADAVEHRGPGLVRAPRQAPERLVEMHVRVDEARQQDAVLPVDHLGAGHRGKPGADARDDAGRGQHVDRCPGHGPHVPDEEVSVHGWEDRSQAAQTRQCPGAVDAVEAAVEPLGDHCLTRSVTTPHRR